MAEIIEMPKLSDTMTDGVLIKWLKEEGAVVKTGDMLAEVETDKATMELESFFDGTLLKVFVPAGSRVPIGAPLCAIGEPGEKVEPPAAPAPAKAVPAVETKAKPAAADVPARAPSSSPPPAPRSRPEPVASSPPAAGVAGDRLRISPLARRIAAEMSVDPARVTGSGPRGRIVRADVLAAAGAKGASPSVVVPRGPIQEERLEPVSNMRATIARRLVEAKATVPHFYLEIEIDAGPIQDFRKQLNDALESEGVRLSLNDFVLRAAAIALARVPAVNCSWEAGGADGQPAIRRHAAAHVSFAVAIEDGLLTPVIRDTHLKSLFAISEEVRTLARRAREKKLAPAEFTGGTFCVTNLGMLGIDRFAAIINPPNAGILAVGTSVRKPVAVGDRIEIGHRMSLTFCGDHRVVDGAVGAAFLAAIRDLLEKPTQLLL